MSDLNANLNISLTSNIEERANRSTRALERMGTRGSRAMSAASRSADQLSKKINTYGNRAVVAGAGASVLLGQQMLKNASKFEQYETILVSTEGSQEAAAEKMKWLTKMANANGAEIATLMESYVSLKNFGIDPANGSMQAILDQSAALGGGSDKLAGITLALGQAWAKGKLQGEEILQLIERGVGVWELLAEATGMNEEQLGKLSERGLLTRDVITKLFAEIGRNNVGAAARYANTWEGMLKQFGNYYTSSISKLADTGAFDVVTESARELLDTIEQMEKEGTLDETIKNFGEELAEGLRTAKDLASGLYDVLQLVGKALAFIAEQMGGWDELAKSLAIIYGLNKVHRFSKKIDNRKKRNDPTAAGAASAYSMTNPMPVFVVNQAGGIIPVGGKNKKTKGGTSKPAGTSTDKLMNRKKKVVPEKVSIAQKAKNIAGKAGNVALPAYLAYETGEVIGGVINDGINYLDRTQGTKISHNIGRVIASFLGALGNEEAKKALALDRKMNGGTNTRGKTKAEKMEARLKIEVDDKRVLVKDISTTAGSVEVAQNLGARLRGAR